jgi:hypothetical protein
MPVKLLRAKAAAAAGLTILSIGGVAAAATGLAPISGERAATQAASRTPGGGAVHGQGDGATATTDHEPRAAAATNGAGSDKPSDQAGGPDASGAARHGLCQAWLAGQGDVHGRRADAPAFQALVAAAGGADRVPAYCQADPTASAGHGRRPVTPPSHAPSKTSPPTTGRPESPGQGQGQGHGQGGPPTTT